MELVFVAYFGQWYASRYFHVGPQLPFSVMVAVIFGIWLFIFGFGLWGDKNPRVRDGV